MKAKKLEDFPLVWAWSGDKCKGRKAHYLYTDKDGLHSCAILDIEFCVRNVEPYKEPKLTVNQFHERLPDEYYKLWLERCDGNKRIHDVPEDGNYGIHYLTFFWDDTPEGHRFWDKVYWWLKNSETDVSKLPKIPKPDVKKLIGYYAWNIHESRPTRIIMPTKDGGIDLRDDDLEFYRFSKDLTIPYEDWKTAEEVMR